MLGRIAGAVGSYSGSVSSDLIGRSQSRPSRPPEDFPGRPGRAGEVREHAVDPEPVEAQVLLDRTSRVGRGEGVVAECPGVDEEAPRVRALDQVGLLDGIVASRAWLKT